jgi:antitoxin (DNA-binding transcriptional repressor) of toxin-antitoxin stability system
MSGWSVVQAAQVYPISQLNQHTSSVLDEINNSGRPAAITKHGRFVALVYPLAGVELESVVLSHGPLAEEFRHYAKDDNQDDLLSTAEVETMIQSHGENYA